MSILEANNYLSTKKLSTQALILLTVATILFSFVLQLNFYILPNYLLEIGVSSKGLYKIKTLESFGYILSSAFLLLLSPYFTSRIVLIITTLIVMFANINISIIDIENILIIYCLLLGAGSYAFFVESLIGFCNITKAYSPTIGVTIFFILICLSNIISQLVLPVVNDYVLKNVTLINTVLTIIIISALILMNETNIKISEEFSLIVDFSRLEIAWVFIISFIFTCIYTQYDLFAQVYKFSDSNGLEILNYFQILALLLIMPLSALSKRGNNYIINIVLAITLITSFILCYQFLDKNFYYFVLIYMILYSLLLNNIFITIKKFYNENLKTPLSILCFIYAAGIYSASNLSELILELFGPAVLITTIYLIVISFTSYYIFTTKKENLI